MRAFCFGQFLADLGRFLADYWQILVDFRHISFTRAAARIYNIWIKNRCKTHEQTMKNEVGVLPKCMNDL